MATYTKQKLSGSTNGKQIKVSATSTPGTAIHTAVAGASDWDEVWIYANNTSNAAVTLTIEWGGVSSPDDTSPVIIPAYSGKVLVVAGEILQNSLAIAAFASVTNVIVISGFVNRITA